MTDHTIERSVIEEVCEYTEIDTAGIYANNYVTRQDETCFAVGMPRASVYPFLIGLGATLTETAMLREDITPTEEAFELSQVVHTVSMGSDVIVSFPGWLLS